MWDAGPPAQMGPPPAVEAAQVHYGGPDRPARALRDLLKAQVEAAPPGSEIYWVTYYFRDRDLAEALARAQARGVRVRLVLDARPRRPRANEAVIARLSRALGDDLRVHRPAIPGPRLHAKIYAFVGPSPVVFVGSFNPSGDEPEDPAVLAEIGDQDRGHNLLVEYREPRTVDAITGQARRIWRGRGVSRLSPRQNRPVDAGPTRIYFFPRLRTAIVGRSLAQAGAGDRIRAAVSHVGRGPFTAGLAKAARRGAQVELVVHDTERRVPGPVIAELARAGVRVRRYCHPDGLPMHAKFVILRGPGRAVAWFGSLNYNFSSRLLNHEILLRSADPVLVSALDRRFDQISEETVRLAAAAEEAESATSADAAATPASYGPVRVAASPGGALRPPWRALAPDRACGSAS